MATAPITVVDFQRPSSAARLQAQLKSSEQAADASLIGAGELLGQTIRAADEAGIHRTAIQRPLLRLHSAIGHALKAQWDLQIFHQHCREQLEGLDLDVLGWGDTSGTPKMAPETFAAAEAAVGA